MKRIFLGLFVQFLMASGLLAQGFQLSPQAKISLLTVAPGSELYSTFGHTALRVQDEPRNFDKVYNWGTFDFETEGFYLKFLRGQLPYYLNPEPYRYFEYANLTDKRSMRESELNLTAEEKQRMFDLLLENLKPENLYYQYDFFYDNCATRPRDLVAKTFGYQIEWDSTLYKAEPKTMRQLLYPYMKDKPWTWFGMQLVLGIPTDKKAELNDFFFLPDHLYSIFSKTKIEGQRPLLGNETLRPDPPFPIAKYEGSFLTSPLFAMALVLAIGLLSFKNRRFSTLFDRIFWFVLGVLGLLFAFLWFGTDHSTTKFNLNILWALPFHLLTFWRSRKTAWVDLYYIGAGIFAGLFLLFFKWLPQGEPVEVLPVVVLVLIKGIWGRRWERTEEIV